MKKSILFVLVALISLNVTSFVSASQKITVNPEQKFSFVSTSSQLTQFDLNVEKFKKSKDSKKSSSKDKDEKYAKIADAMLGLGIAGAVVLGVSVVMIISGAVLWGVFIAQYGLTAFAAFSAAWWAYTYAAVTTSAPYMLFVGGGVLMGFGLSFFWIGLAMCIVGFVLHSVFKNKAGIAYNLSTETPSYSTAISIKL